MLSSKVYLVFCNLCYRNVPTAQGELPLVGGNLVFLCQLKQAVSNEETL